MSNNLSLSQVAASQNQKEVTINDQAGQLDAALTEVLTVEVDDSNAAGLSIEQFQRHNCFKLVEGTPAPTGAVTLVVPALKRGFFAVLNSTAWNAGVEVSGQSEDPAPVAAGDMAALHCDGTDVRPAGGGGSGGSIAIEDEGVEVVADATRLNFVGAGVQATDAGGGEATVTVLGPYDVAFFFGGTPEASSLVARLIAARAFTLPQNLPSSQGKAETAPSAQTDFDIQKNGVSAGTMRFAASDNEATFTMASNTAYAAGDILDVVAPADLNGLADLAFTLAGTRG